MKHWIIMTQVSRDKHAKDGQVSLEVHRRSKCLSAPPTCFKWLGEHEKTLDYLLNINLEEVSYM